VLPQGGQAALDQLPYFGRLRSATSVLESVHVLLVILDHGGHIGTVELSPRQAPETGDLFLMPWADARSYLQAGSRGQSTPLCLHPVVIRHHVLRKSLDQ
jgi:hypothetical protein